MVLVGPKGALLLLLGSWGRFVLVSVRVWLAVEGVAEAFDKGVLAAALGLPTPVLGIRLEGG